MARLNSPQSRPLSPVLRGHLFGSPQSSQLLLSSNAVTSPLRLEFTCFPKLPAEMRCEIWKSSMLPRNVDIYVRELGSVRSGRFQIAELYSTTPVPVVLQVCQESRAVGLIIYRLCFGTFQVKASENRKDLITFIRSPSTYFSYQMDTASFKYTKYAGTPWHNIPTAYMHDRDLKNIRHLSVNWGVHASDRLIQSMASFEKLETFTLSWFWHEKLGDESYDTDVLEDVEVTEENYELPNRPDIHQFMISLKLARDVFTPGYQIPLLRIKSLNSKQIEMEMLMMVYVILEQ